MYRWINCPPKIKSGLRPERSRIKQVNDVSADDRVNPWMSWQRGWLIAGGVGAALCAALALFDLAGFLQGYLLGFLFWWVIAIGCLGLVMLHDLVGGGWGDLARPFLRAGAAPLPLLAALFLVVLLGMTRLYPWLDADVVAAHATLQQKAAYLNPAFFMARAAAYFLIWIGLGGFVCSWRLFRPLRPREEAQRRLLSAVGLVVLVVTVSFAAVDWAMSLDPLWSSTMFGALIAMGGAAAALALGTASAAYQASGRREPADQWADAHRSPRRAEIFADLGSLLMAFVMLWAYFAFSQYLIVWSGNLPAEATWYASRLRGSGSWLALVIVLLHFAAPFALLLAREVKQNPAALGSLAIVILLAHFLYLYWTVVPSFGRLAPRIGDLLVPATMGCLWIAGYLHGLPHPLWHESSTEHAGPGHAGPSKDKRLLTEETFHA
jgi:hypothetical protein